jgi:hypothetical protein
MDSDTVDRAYANLQQQSQQTGRSIESLAGKLQAAAAAGDQSAREWLLDLKEVALAVHSEEAQTAQLLLAVHQLVDTHVQQATGPNGAQYVQQAYQQPLPPQPAYQQQGYPQQQGYAQPYPQQGYQQQGGGGMLGRFLSGGFGSAIASGAGFAVGDDLVNGLMRDIF